MAINPDLRYENNSDSFALYNYAIDLTSIDNPHLSFWPQTIMTTRDSGFAEISIDEGLNWDRLGNAHIGLQTSWVHNTFSLQNYIEINDIRFRFHFISDSTQTHPGWFIDDIKIEDGITSISEKETSNVTNGYALFTITLILLIQPPQYNILYQRWLP